LEGKERIKPDVEGGRWKKWGKKNHDIGGETTTTEEMKKKSKGKGGPLLPSTGGTSLVKKGEKESGIE